jgi:signal transduction histidine kinase
MDPRLVLVIDDNPDDRALVVRALRAEFPSAGLREIPDAATLEAAFAAGGFDAVVTDYQLLWSTGLDVLREVRGRFPDVPVVMFTNTGSEEVCAQAMREGLHDYIVKRAHHYVLLPAAIRSGLAVVRARQEVRQHAQALQAALAAEKAARSDAERADRLKDEFLSTLSHELRTPLNAILGWTHVLQRSPDKVESVAKGMQVIERNVKVQVRIIEDLLDVSKIVSGNLRLEAQPVELVPVIDAAIESVAPAADIKGVRLLRTLDMQAAPVMGDATRLQQVVWNLLTNAIKFTPQDGRVEVRLERAGQTLVLTVADTGEGIDANFLPFVFDRLRQGDGSTTRRHSGLGLGLSIVKHLVELHGGRVLAESPGRGHGSRFTVTLPLAPVQAPAERASDRGLSGPRQPAREPEAVDLSGVDVLLVDDEADARELMQRVLLDAGARVRLAGSAAEALREFGQRRPDILVSDVGMPDEDGYTLMGQVRRLEDEERTSRVPAIALTAFARAEDRRKALLAGFQLHIAKPIEPAELTAAIASLSGRTGR